jgi:hypothetical protein
VTVIPRRPHDDREGLAVKAHLERRLDGNAVENLAG